MKKIISLTAALALSQFFVGCTTTKTCCPVAQPSIQQSVSGFYRPESSTFSLDGKNLYVTNCGSGFYGVDAKGEKQFSLAQDKGAVSKLSVAEDGTLTMVDAKFFPKTSGALGISTLPVATKLFPKGTLIFNSGFFMQTDLNDKYVDTQKKLDPKMIMIDPVTGKELGSISFAMNGELSKAINNPIFVPNGITFDSEGNLYFAETGGSSKFIKGSADKSNKTGVIKIPHSAIDRLAKGKKAKGIKFLEAPAVNGVGYDKKTDSLILLTFTGEGDSVYKVSLKDFEAGILPKPFVTGQGRLDGIVFTSAGTMLVTDVTNQSLLKIDSKGNVETVKFGDKKFNGPSDIKIKTLKDGSSIVILPEQEFTAPQQWIQNVHVIKIPAGY